MVLSFVFLGIYVFLFMLSARNIIPDNLKAKWYWIPFYKISFLLLNLRLNKTLLGHDKMLEKNLQAVYMGKSNSTFLFNSQRLAAALGIMFIGTSISFAAEMMLNFESSKIEDALQRPDYGQGDRAEELQAKIEGEKELVNLSIILKEQNYTKSQQQEFIRVALDKMESWILGDNRSLDEVRKNLNLHHSFMDGKIKAEWITEPFGIFDENGEIIKELPEQGILVKLTAELSCGKELGTYETFVKVLPPVYTESDKLIFTLKKEVEKRNEEKAEEKMLELPDTVNGKTIVWSKGRQKVSVVICILAVIASVCYFLQKDRELDKLAQKRRNQMAMDYPDILFKLSMLIEAGLTLRAAFSKIVLEYKTRNLKDRRYAYEEMLKTYYEMETGIAEALAYENFGKRCQVSEYIKLGTMLAQNLKKGSDGLVQILRNEALISLEERKLAARKIGEEAGTKMLLPMGLMLVIVLVILMVPALLSF